MVMSYAKALMTLGLSTTLAFFITLCYRIIRVVWVYFCLKLAFNELSIEALCLTIHP